MEKIIEKELAELKKKVEKKITLKKGEWEKTVKMCEEELKEFGIDEKQLPKKIFTYFSRILKSHAEVFECIIFGVSDITDFGAKKEYDKMIEMWRIADTDLRKGMIEKGYCDEQGRPLWNKDNTKNARKYVDDKGNNKQFNERLIQPEREKQKGIVGIFGKYVEGVKTEFKVGNLTLRGDKLDVEVPKYKLCRVSLYGKFNEDKNLYYLNNTKETNFVTVKEDLLSYKEYGDIIDKYYKDQVIDLKKEEDTSKIISDQRKGNVFIKNALVINVRELETRSNMVEIGSMNMGFDENNITCWLPKTEPLPPEGIGEAIVLGRLNVNENRVTINALSIFNSIAIKKPKIMPKEMKKEKKKENEDDEDYSIQDEDELFDE